MHGMKVERMLTDKRESLRFKVEMWTSWCSLNLAVFMTQLGNTTSAVGVHPVAFGWWWANLKDGPFTHLTRKSLLGCLPREAGKSMTNSFALQDSEFPSRVWISAGHSTDFH